MRCSGNVFVNTGTSYRGPFQMDQPYLFQTHFPPFDECSASTPWSRSDKRRYARRWVSSLTYLLGLGLVYKYRRRYSETKWKQNVSQWTYHRKFKLILALINPVLRAHRGAGDRAGMQSAEMVSGLFPSALICSNDRLSTNELNYFDVNLTTFW